MLKKPERSQSRSCILLTVSLAVNLLLLGMILAAGWIFRERLLQYYIAWKGEASVVFFGDSITAHGDWNKLLGKTDIRNSGIPGLGVIHLKEELERGVLSYSPEKCVIMAGINDLTILGRSVDQTIIDYREILERLQKEQITPIVQLTLYERQNPVINAKVDSLNTWLISYCDSAGIKRINPNLWLSDESGLKREYAADRTHLTPAAYKVWATELAIVLEEQSQNH